MTHNYNSIIAALLTGPTKIRFTKKDGTQREIFGTLNNNFTPVDIDPTKILPDQSIVKFWSLDHNGWRSFLVENFKGFSGELIVSRDKETNEFYHPILRNIAPQLDTNVKYDFLQ